MEWKSVAQKAGKAALLALCGLGGAASLATVLAAWIMVRPGKQALDCIPRIRVGKLEPLCLTTSDGLRLHAWIQLSPRSLSNGWVILLHGYRSDREVLQTRRRFFVRRGFHTLLLHFRGHGGSQPARISYGFEERKDVRAAVEFIRSLYPGKPVRIGIDGVSMGAAAAVYAIARESIDPDWVILESCYDNIRRALANRLELHLSHPFVPLVARPLEFVAEHLFRLHLADLDVVKALEKVCCPVLVLAGDSEKVLKTAEVEFMYGRIPGPKELVIFPGAGHDDLLSCDPRRYIREVGSFLRRICSPAPGSVLRRGGALAL